MLVSLAARRLQLLHRAQYSTVRAVHQLSRVGEQDINHFSRILSTSSIISTLPPISSHVDELDSYNTDWIGRYHGRSTTVLKPKSTQEVSDILKWCNERRIGIVPQGGNTGLVGGSVPLDDEVILSLSGMNKVRAFDPVSGYCPRHSPCVLCIHF